MSDDSSPRESGGSAQQPDRGELFRAVTSPAEFARELETFIVSNPDIFGGADIYTLAYQNPAMRAGTLAAVLFGLTDSDRRRAVRNYLIIAPPGTDTKTADSTAWTAFESAFAVLAGRGLEDGEAKWLRPRFNVLAAPNSRSTSVLGIIDGQSERTAIIVTEAAEYRDDMVDTFVAPGSLNPSRQEDIWAPQLYALARDAAAIARTKAIYVTLDANRLSPSRAELAALLRSIDGCGVLGSTNDAAPESILAAHVDQWTAWIREGRVGRALQDLDQLPAALNRNKPFLRIQLLHRAGLHLQALQAIRDELVLGRNLDASSRVKLARVALDANAKGLARDLLNPAVDQLTTQEDLESALTTARESEANKLEEDLANKLNALFPDSPGLRERRRRTLHAERNYSTLATMAKEEPEGAIQVAFYATLEHFLSGNGVPDYLAMIASASHDAERADALRMAAIEDAVSRRLVVHAFELARLEVQFPAWAGRRDRLLLQVLQDLFLLAGKDEKLPVPNDDIQSAVVSLIQRLASDPNDQRLRIGLTSLIQPSIAGTKGLALIASIVLELAARPLTLDKRPLPGNAEADWLHQHNEFLNSLFAWLKSEEPVIIGRLTLPPDLLTEPADPIVSGIADYLTHAPIASEEDIRAQLVWLTLAAAVAPHTSDPDFDLRLVRLVAGRLASVGFLQLGRDLAEQALLNSAATARRRRLGWFAMADVYHRGHNHIEGLLALACALTADDHVDEEEAFQEIVCLARLLRDSGLLEFARYALDKAREVLERMDLVNVYGHRVDTLDLQIRQRSLRGIDAASAEFLALLTDVVRTGEEVIARYDQTEPIAAVLSQLLCQAREVGADAPPKAEDVLEELVRRSKGGFAIVLRAMQSASPSAADVLAVLSAGGATRYSDDVGFDMINVAILASRALADDAFLGSPVDVSFALEVLADRGVAMPGWDGVAEPPPPPRSVNEPKEIACKISRQGISVVQAGWDNRGRLVRVEAIAGELKDPVRDSDKLIAEERFRTWSASFPYGYGVDETTANLFYMTTKDLRFATLPKGPVVLIADVRFQPFPPNLLFIDGEFAGRTRPMAAAPSLAWLRAATAKGMIGDGRLCAWISTAHTGSGSQTLALIAERLAPIFNEHGFVVDHGPELPAAFASATMAVITAHGGVHPEGRYFQVLSDEGILRVSAGDLANALRNVAVVVLFVCSGGRADKHPGANTALGLAKQILDRGSTAVIASPWPLDARVPSHWLPAFLDRWNQGVPLIEANFAANRSVDRAFALDPARGLAMTLFGNPLLKRS